MIIDWSIQSDHNIRQKIWENWQLLKAFVIHKLKLYLERLLLSAPFFRNYHIPKKKGILLKYNNLTKNHHYETLNKF